MRGRQQPDNLEAIVTSVDDQSDHDRVLTISPAASGTSACRRARYPIPDVRRQTAGKAEQAMSFYVSLFGNSAIRANGFSRQFAWVQDKFGVVVIERLPKDYPTAM